MQYPAGGDGQLAYMNPAAVSLNLQGQGLNPSTVV
jgi:hypothetical protein